MLGLALSSAVAAASIAGAGYQSIAPRAQWYGPTFTRLPPDSRRALRLPRCSAGCGWRSLQFLSPALRRTPPRGSPDRTRTRPRAGYVERDRLRLERPAS